MRCSAISAFTRVFDALWRSDAKWCAADPGPFHVRCLGSPRSV